MGFFSRRGSGSEASQKKPETTYFNAFLDKAFSSPGVQRDVPRLSRSERESDFPREERGVPSSDMDQEEKLAQVIPIRERQEVGQQTDPVLEDIQQAAMGLTDYRFTIPQGRDNKGVPYNSNPEYWQGMADKLAQLQGNFKDASAMAGNIASHINRGDMERAGRLFAQFEEEVNDAISDGI